MSPFLNIAVSSAWICIYPAYINSKKTLEEGRCFRKDKCVENPSHQEMKDVLQTTGLKIGVENKLYSRERSKEMLYRGRIRVHLKNDDGTPVNNAFPTRTSILLYLCTMIPKLKSRASKQSGADHQSSQSGGGGGGGGAASGQGGGGNKKKGKGRR